MARISSLRLSLGAALLLANVCYAQDSASASGDSGAPADASASGDSAAPADASTSEPMMSIFAAPAPTDAGSSDTAVAAAAAAATTTDDGASGVATTQDVGAGPAATTFAYPPGSYPIGDTTYYVSCESGDMNSEWSPSLIVQGSANIDDYGTCMAFCESLGKVLCVTAMWNPESTSPCQILQSYQNLLSQPFGRCYGTRPYVPEDDQPSPPTGGGFPPDSSSDPDFPVPPTTSDSSGPPMGGGSPGAPPGQSNTFAPSPRKYSNDDFPSEPSNPGYYPSTPGYSQSGPNYYPSDPDYYPSNPGYSQSGPDSYPSDRDYYPSGQGYYPSDHGSSPSDYDNDRIPPFVTSPQDHGGRRPKGKRPHKCKGCEQKKEKGY